MTRIARSCGFRNVIASALVLAFAAAPSPVIAAADPFEAMAVQRPAEAVAAPDLVFVSPEGREARLGDLRGKVVLLGFFTTS
jgi:cytochrome oxidase Cu insertion factor (SCO1/SenC/PrrC family)